ncbi:MAG: dTDP-4-dehydrorhamnose reductase [Candidatus Aminicenantes bacterium]|nr:dTDP-4-dehydrorhamnose reductase [Candidatus Aminicenantes bacterium]
MRILITGGKGQLSWALKKELEHHTLLAPSREELNITDFRKFEQMVSEFKPEFLINTAAMTNVDACEDEPLKAFAVNAIAPGRIAEFSERYSFTLIHISTDYVFDGRKKEPYIEEDCAFPISVYGNSKLAGENLVNSNSSESYVLRTAGLFGPGGRKNFVRFVVENLKEGRPLKIVSDRYSSPTYTLELARQIKIIIEKKPLPGVYHATSEGECSWYDFAKRIAEIKGFNSYLISPVKAEEFKQKAMRPLYSVLENRKLKNAGLNVFSHCMEALERYLLEYPDL